MMRLIDAEYLIKNINENDKLPWNLDKISQVAFKSCVNAMPTAYDVDKVIVVLENLINRYGNEDFAIKGILYKAIEIVKRGNATDDVCEWKKSEEYPFDWIVGCDGCEVNHMQGDYCPRCGKKIKVV